jgi:hypothetical protein
MAVALAAPSGAGTWGQMDNINFSRAVTLPGVVLPAGSYIFEIANPNTSADVVRVINRGTGQVHFLGFTQRVKRARNARDEMVTLGEASRGQATPVTAWYPAAGTNGHQFLYR